MSYADDLCGWVRNDTESDRVTALLSTPFFAAPAPDETKDVMNHLIFKEFTGRWAYYGYQGIGDCVGWGWARFLDYTQVLEAYLQVLAAIDSGVKAADIGLMADTLRYQFQKSSSEVVYALSRVQVGGGRIGGDGSVGAWAAKAVEQFGFTSYEHLKTLGLGDKYDPNRARQWGASGPPSNVLQGAKDHLIQDTTPVTDVMSAAYHIQNHRVVPVCSNYGFENGGNGMTVRDKDGFASPRGTWNHCMDFTAVRFGRRPGLLLENQWPEEQCTGPTGPTDLPPSSMWVEFEVADQMLRQNDSYTGSTVKGYPARKLTWGK